MRLRVVMIDAGAFCSLATRSIDNEVRACRCGRRSDVAVWIERDGPARASPVLSISGRVFWSELRINTEVARRLPC